MNNRSFIKGVIVGAVIIIALLVLLFFAMPYIYLATENSNFAKLREKSELNCKTMPLHCLVRNEQMEKISQYTVEGKDLELKDNWGKTALFWAASEDKPLMVSKLLSLNANPNTKDENGRSVFYQLVAWSKYDMANELLDNGADINAYNDNKYPETALHYCIMKDNPECVRYLLDKGASAHLKDSFGYTVFERVRIHDHISKEVGMLLKK
jgi:ankyrin repeat protein